MGNNAKTSSNAMAMIEVEIRAVIPKIGSMIDKHNAIIKVTARTAPILIITFNGELLISLKNIGFLSIVFISPFINKQLCTI